MSEQKLKMKFDINTIKHLGVMLYSNLPPVLAELVANSWDADATEVQVILNDENEKEIIIKDNGNGMSFEEINNDFLLIGRNRRLTLFDLSERKSRPVIGRKGVGKLAVFGIADTIIINTIKNNFENEFIMKFSEIEKITGEKEYLPKISIFNKKTTKKNGTTITLKDLKRKSKFKSEEIAISLAKAFSIFTSKDEDENNKFYVEIIHNGYSSMLTNELKFKNYNFEFTWNFPEDFLNSDIDLEYAKLNNINGKIYSNSTPLRGKNNGFVLFVRGKSVQENSFFNNRANDLAHSYLTGYLNVDFIDEVKDKDLIATDRNSLIWENEELTKLEEILNGIIKYVANDWKKKRAQKKQEELEKDIGSIEEWLRELTLNEQTLAKKIVNALLQNNSLDKEKTASFFKHIKDVFSFESFKDFATKLDNLGVLNNEDAIKLLEDWQFIEAKEMAKIAEGRIKTIEQFEKHIVENASENKVMQKFLEEFPWLLDPRMVKFDREVTYSRLLKEKFNDEVLDESNRRLDFLCCNNSGVVHVIELKRPRIRITSKEITQAMDYESFLSTKFPNDIKELKVILISDNFECDRTANSMIESFSKDGKLEVKSYSDLLAQAIKYHRSFIELYDNLKELKEKKKQS
ncbi:ATP-binding protein [uncultured Fusobacterium sp.]|uniref:ATP-binding protein n=1 Tax=uncultured Fusobacterium sp. TaxID=159267 RepID=UPI002592D622|nr:ATP-binding protein [uncultured Fusobacterium sp.]